jgi:hypothetical protein
MSERKKHSAAFWIVIAFADFGVIALAVIGVAVFLIGADILNSP